MPLTRGTLAMAAVLIAATSPSRADEADLRGLYERFVTAQNARDLAAVKAVLWDSPSFLWVSDGKSVWGRDALVARMAEFQRADVWRVEPNLAKSVAAELDAHAGYLHLPLVLVIGAADRPDRLRWLVSMLGVETEAGWRIAALFTTADKGPVTPGGTQ